MKRAKEFKVYFWEKPGLNVLHTLSTASYKYPYPGYVGLVAMILILIMALSFQIRGVGMRK